MNIFSDWKFWLFAVSTCQTILLVYGFVIIKYNDFRHLEKNVKEINENLDEITAKIIDVDKKQAVQEQKIKTLENSIK